MNKLRKALLEMFFIGLVIGIAFRLTGRNVSDAAGFFSCMLTGLLLSPFGWAIYRLARFMFLPRRSSL
jgi:uncharacterized membrane protein YczE